MFYCYVGLRGSGKSCYAAKLSRKYIKKGIKVYCNFLLDGCYMYDVSDLGQYMIENCVLILDEAGIDVSNREWKTGGRSAQVNSRAFRNFWKKSRHYGIQDIHVFSQAFDFDITLRRLADRMFIIRNTIIPHFSILKSVRPKWDIDEDGQPTIKWTIMPLLFKPFFRLPYYRYYDSFEVDLLPEKEFFKVHSIGGKPDTKELLFRSMESLLESYSWYVNICSMYDWQFLSY